MDTFPSGYHVDAKTAPSTGRIHITGKGATNRHSTSQVLRSCGGRFPMLCARHRGVRVNGWLLFVLDRDLRLDRSWLLGFAGCRRWCSGIGRC